MNDNTKMLDSLLEKASDYGKSSFELIRLKTLDKTTEVISSIVPYSLVVFLTAFFLLFLNLGIAFLLGDLFGKDYFGFLAVAIFYILAALFIHFILHEQIKKAVGDFIIKQILK
jgi:hypothetical protein